MQMENRKEGVHLTLFQFKEQFPDTKTLKQKRSGPKGLRQNVLNNKVPVKVMDWEIPPMEDKVETHLLGWILKGNK